MKVFSSVLAVLVASSVGLTGCSQPEKIEDGQIRVVLPKVAEVALKAGESKSGRLTKIEEKQLIIENSGSSAKVDIAKVEKITFKGEISYESNGQIVIRGEDKQTTTQRATLADIPVTDFKLQETKIGEANVKLPPAVKEKNSGLPTVAKDSPVVVEEMKFNSATGKMTLKVKW